MTSTAQINDQYLSLGGEEDTSLHHEINDRESVVTDRLSQNALFDSVSAFYYNDRAKVTFNVAGEFETDFSLIRGLIDFNRPRDLRFSFDRESKTVSTNIAMHQLGRLDEFLSFIYDELIKEKRFRKTLRAAIEFEKRYNRERDRIYAELKSAIAPTNMR